MQIKSNLGLEMIIWMYEKMIYGNDEEREQKDLFQMASCGRMASLGLWLNQSVPKKTQ